MMDTNIVELKYPQSDTEIAKELRTRIEKTMEPLLAVVNDAKTAGFRINFNVGPIYGGRIGIVALDILKEF